MGHCKGFGESLEKGYAFPFSPKAKGTCGGGAASAAPNPQGHPPRSSNTGGFHLTGLIKNKHLTFLLFLSFWGGFMGVTVLGGGWDLSGLTAQWALPKFSIEAWDAVHANLKRIKADYEPVQLAGEKFELQAYRTMGYFFFKSDAVNIFINPDLKPSIKAQISSRGVHAYGHAALVELIKNVGTEFGKPYFIAEPLKLYRQDFNLDVQVDKINIDTRNVYARGKRGMIQDDDLGVETINVGSRGKESVYARLYDKMAEIEQKKTYWNLEVLQAYPAFNEMRPVLRVEFEIGGGWLKKFGMREYDNLKNDGGAVARYLVNEHLRLVVPYECGKNANRDIQLLPLWKAVQDYINEIYHGDLWKFRVASKDLEYTLHKQYLIRQDALIKLSMQALEESRDKKFSYAMHSRDVLDHLNSLSDETKQKELAQRKRRYMRLGIKPVDGGVV